jgi:ATP-dependent exoDNAse (exonuclease V) beta subunit
VAEQVKELLDKGEKPTDIAILTRGNKEIGTLAAWFEAHPEAFAPHEVRLVSGEAFKLESSDAVRLLVGAMRWVKDEEDIVSLAQVAIAWHRFVKNDGLAVSDILAMKECHYGLPEAFVTQHASLSELPLSALIYTLFEVLEMKQMEGQAAWMQSFFDLVQHYASEKGGTLSEFLKEWDDTLCEKAIPSGEADGIACMTIHKAKGLEWDSVIVLGTNWKFEKNNMKPILWVETNPDEYENLPILPIKRVKDMQESDFAMQYDEETRQIWMDNLNLLYVAFTRPKSNLVIIKEATKKTEQTSEKKEIVINDIGDFIELGVMTPNKTSDSQTNSPADESSTCDSEAEISSDSLPVCPSDSQEKEFNPLLPHSETVEVGFHATPVQLPFRQSNSSRTYINRGDDSPMSEFIERGNLLHEVFAHIGKAEDAQQAIEDLFTQGIIDAEEREEIARIVDEALRQPEVSEWFSGRYELFNECTILTMEEGIVVQKRPDRVMRSADKTIVVDFKFGEPVGKHQRQVVAYMSLLRQMGFENVEGYLWYVTQQKIVRV